MAEVDYRLEKENKKFRQFGEHTMINVSSILDVSLTELRIEYDGDGNVIYQGWAVVGSSESEAVWLISKLNYDGGGNILERVWANGEDTFTKVWDSRDSYNYSY